MRPGEPRSKPGNFALWKWLLRLDQQQTFSVSRQKGAPAYPWRELMDGTFHGERVLHAVFINHFRRTPTQQPEPAPPVQIASAARAVPGDSFHLELGFPVAPTAQITFQDVVAGHHDLTGSLSGMRCLLAGARAGNLLAPPPTPEAEAQPVGIANLHAQALEGTRDKMHDLLIAHDDLQGFQAFVLHLHGKQLLSCGATHWARPHGTDANDLENF